MANTLTLVKSTRGEWRNPQGWFTEVWTVEATIDDQDAIAANDTATFSVTVPGVALGDVVLGCTINKDLSDGTDQALVLGWVTAADTVSLYVQADVGTTYAADDLNGSTVKMVVGRPAW